MNPPQAGRLPAVDVVAAMLSITARTRHSGGDLGMPRTRYSHARMLSSAMPVAAMTR